MLTLFNEGRDVSDTLFNFPSGEAHLKPKGETIETVAWMQGYSADDLFALAMWAEAHCDTWTRLLLPYLPGARADRGSPLGAKVYAKFINSLNIDSVVCLDPHSDVAPALYDRLTTVRLEDLDVWETMPHYGGVIAPDLGARKRAEAVATKLNIPLYQAYKHREPGTGKLSNFSCETLPPNRPYLVVDDICDGGGTFLGLADAINVPVHMLDLWVTHGVFSNNAVEKLKARYKTIYTTDSFSRTEGTHVKSVFHTLLEAR